MGYKKWTFAWCLGAASEALFYIAVLALWFLCETHDYVREMWSVAIDSRFGAWLPQAHSNGWGGTTFVSLATGLNIALVKFESFLKSLDEIKSRWEKEVESELEQAEVTSALADDEGFHKVVEEKVRESLSKATETNSRFWRKSRWWAQRLMIIGVVYLFIQYSVGFLGIIMLCPVLSAWLAKLWARSTLKDSTSRIVDAARLHHQVMLACNNKKITDIEQQLTNSMK
jgi:hypothetical protein